MSNLTKINQATSEREEIEITVAEAQAAIDLAESLKRLYKNKDFKKVFVDCFKKDNVILNVHAMKRPDIVNDEVILAGIRGRLNAVAELVEFERKVIEAGTQFEMLLKDHDNYQMQLANEE